MSKAKTKGRNGEHAIVNKHKALGIEAERVPLSGSLGGKYSGDIAIPSVEHAILRCEVKSRKSDNGFAVIRNWLGESDIMFIREDYRDPLVVMPWETYEKLIKAFINEQHKTSTNITRL